MVKLYCLNINLFEKEFENILPTLSFKRIEKINKLKQKNDKLLSMGAELILKYVFYHSNLKYDFEISENEFGKPYTKDKDDFYFNISHSGDYIVCATSSMPVGVDIEKISDYNVKIAEKYFSKNEIEFISKNSFFDIWVHKESFVKAVGKGLPLLKNKNNLVEKGKISDILFNNIKYYFKSYEIDKAYKLAVCSQDENFNNEIIFIKNWHYQLI